MDTHDDVAQDEEGEANADVAGEVDEWDEEVEYEEEEGEEAEGAGRE